LGARGPRSGRDNWSIGDFPFVVAVTVSGYQWVTTLMRDEAGEGTTVLAG